jgi:single-stranded DNA-specific DHH superfamily exonuclease
MESEMESSFNKARDFLKNLYGKICLVSDSDTDGIAGGVVISNIVKSIIKEYPTIILDNHFIPYLCEYTIEIYNEIERNNFDFIIFVDMPVHQGKDYIFNLADRSKILIIDHHVTDCNLEKEHPNIIHVNPHLNGELSSIPPSNYPASKLSYDICYPLNSDISKNSWLTCAGLINDFSSSYFKDFFNYTYNIYPELKEGNDIYGYESKIGKITKFINSGFYNSGREGAKESFNICLNAESYNDVLNSEILNKFVKENEEEFKEVFEKYKSNAKIYEKEGLVIYLADTNKNFIGPIANNIGKLELGKTIVVAKREGDLIYISFRNPKGDVNCEKLAKITAGGGGHPKAAGGQIKAQKWEEFEKLLLERLPECKIN